MKGTRVKLTEAASIHYPKSFAERSSKVGEVICEMPSGSVVVSFPWGIGDYHPSEIRGVS